MPTKKKTAEVLIQTPEADNTGTISVEAEEVFPEEKIEEEISQELVKANVTDKVIAQLKEKYSHLTINGQEDKEGYLAVQEGRKDFKKLRVLVSKVCKKGREWAVLEQRKWKSKEDELCDIIEVEEKKLEVLEKAWEAERDRLKAELKQKQDKDFAIRSAELNAFGAVFNGSEYALQDVAYELSAIREADEEIYSTMIKPKYEAIFNANETVRIAAEKEKSDAAAALLLQQEQFAAREQEMKDRESALLAKENEVKAAEAAKIEAARLALENHQRQLVKTRAIQLGALGMTYDYGKEVYSGYGFTIELLGMKSLSEGEWDTRLSEVTTGITEAKEQHRIAAENAEKERIRLAEVEAEKQKAAAIAKAIEDEKERVRLQGIKDAQAAEQAKILAQQQLDAASDRVKWEALMTSLAAIVIPDFKSKGYREKASFIADFLDGVKNN